MPLMMMRRKFTLRLLIAAIIWGVCGGCTAAGSSFRGADREAVMEMVPELPSMNIELMVSNGDQDPGEQYPTTLLVESYAAPGSSTLSTRHSTGQIVQHVRE